MFKKSIIAVLVLSLALFVFVGCEEEPDEEEETVDDDVVEITVAGGAVGQELELTQDAAERYNDKNEDVNVRVMDVPDGADDRQGLYLQFLEAESSEIDVMQIDVIWPGELGEHFVDLYDYGADEVVDKHFEPIVENNTVDEELVAIPWFTDAGLLYYREDLLEEYGHDVPETWDELEAAAEDIMEGERADNPDFEGFVFQGDAYEGLTTNALEWVVSHEGGSIVEDDGEISINNPEAVAAVERAGDWVGDIAPDGVTGMMEEDARAVFQDGNAAFMRNWPYAYALGQEDDSPIKDKFGVAPLPAGPDGEPAGTLGGWQLAVSQYSEDPEVAADVALFMASYEEQKTRAIEGSLNPTIEELYEDDEVLDAVPFFGELYEVFVNAEPRPSTATAPYYSDVSRAFYNAVYDVLLGEEDAETALEYLELDLEDILE